MDNLEFSGENTSKITKTKIQVSSGVPRKTHGSRWKATAWNSEVPLPPHTWRSSVGVQVAIDPTSRRPEIQGVAKRGFFWVARCCEMISWLLIGWFGDLVSKSKNKLKVKCQIAKSFKKDEQLDMNQINVKLMTIDAVDSYLDGSCTLT